MRVGGKGTLRELSKNVSSNKDSAGRTQRKKQDIKLGENCQNDNKKSLCFYLLNALRILGVFFCYICLFLSFVCVLSWMASLLLVVKCTVFQLLKYNVILMIA